jgi:hypothetical protein
MPWSQEKDTHLANATSYYYSSPPPHPQRPVACCLYFNDAPRTGGSRIGSKGSGGRPRRCGARPPGAAEGGRRAAPRAGGAVSSCGRGFSRAAAAVMSDTKEKEDRKGSGVGP